MAINQTDMTPSQAIRKCMRIAWESFYEKLYTEYNRVEIERIRRISLNETGNDLSAETEKGTARRANAGVKTLRVSENLDSMSSTATTARSRKTG